MTNLLFPPVWVVVADRRCTVITEEQQQGLSREQYRAFVRATPAIVRSHRTEAPLTTISRRREASGRGQGREAFV